MTISRLTPERYRDTEFSGEGALRYPGRWHRPGRRVVYAAQHLSQAVLETLVNLDAEPPPAFVYFRIEMAEQRHVQVLSEEELPAGWNHSVWQEGAQLLGSAWLQARTTPVLQVPTVIVPGEFNCLLSPEHPHFGELRIEGPFPYTLDQRLRS